MSSGLNAWEELGRIHAKCVDACAGIKTLLQKDVLAVPTERFTSGSDFKTRATVISISVIFQFTSKSAN